MVEEKDWGSPPKRIFIKNNFTKKQRKPNVCISQLAHKLQLSLRQCRARRRVPVARRVGTARRVDGRRGRAPGAAQLRVPGPALGTTRPGAALRGQGRAREPRAPSVSLATERPRRCQCRCTRDSECHGGSDHCGHSSQPLALATIVHSGDSDHEESEPLDTCDEKLPQESEGHAVVGSGPKSFPFSVRSPRRAMIPVTVSAPRRALGNPRQDLPERVRLIGARRVRVRARAALSPLAVGRQRPGGGKGASESAQWAGLCCQPANATDATPAGSHSS